MSLALAERSAASRHVHPRDWEGKAPKKLRDFVISLSMLSTCKAIM